MEGRRNPLHTVTIARIAVHTEQQGARERAFSQEDCILKQEVLLYSYLIPRLGMACPQHTYPVLCHMTSAGDNMGSHDQYIPEKHLQCQVQPSILQGCTTAVETQPNIAATFSEMAHTRYHTYLIPKHP